MVWVIDSTGSMRDNIANVRVELNNILDNLIRLSKSYRVAIVQYNDPNDGIEAGVVLPFSTDEAVIRAAIAGLKTERGGDHPEHVYSGIFIAIFLPWRPGAGRISMVIGDAPQKDPEPGTGLTLSRIRELADSIAVFPFIDPTLPARMIAMERQSSTTKTIRVPFKGLNPLFMIPIGDSRTAPKAAFKPLAKGTGGKVFPAKTSSGVSKAIIKAIKSATAPRIAVKKLIVQSYCWRGFSNHRITIENVNAFDVSFTWLTKAGGKKITGSGTATKSSTTNTDILFPSLANYVVKVTWNDRGKKRSAKVSTRRDCYCTAFSTTRFCSATRMFGKFHP